MKFECSEYAPPVARECDYVEPPLTSLLIRKNKKGKLQVRVNGKGKWVDAEVNIEKRTITYTV